MNPGKLDMFNICSLGMFRQVYIVQAGPGRYNTGSGRFDQTGSTQAVNKTSYVSHNV